MAERGRGGGGHKKRCRMPGTCNSAFSFRRKTIVLFCLAHPDFRVPPPYSASLFRAACTTSNMKLSLPFNGAPKASISPHLGKGLFLPGFGRGKTPPNFPLSAPLAERIGGGKRNPLVSSLRIVGNTPRSKNGGRELPKHTIPFPSSFETCYS